MQKVLAFAVIVVYYKDMKKHILRSYGKKYLHVENGQILDHKFVMVNLFTYCGKEYATVEEAIAAGVKNSVVGGDPQICKSCARWSRNAKDRRQSMLDREMGHQYKEMQRI